MPPEANRLQLFWTQKIHNIHESWYNLMELRVAYPATGLVSMQVGN